MALNLLPRIFERYVAREIILATILVLGGFVALFAFFDLINELDDVGRSGYQLHHALRYVALLVPGRAYELLPVSVLIGALYSLSVLARHSELTVLRSSGLATSTMLMTLVKVGAIFALLTLMIGEFVVPASERAASRLRLEAMGALVAQEFRSGLWIKDERAFVNVRKVLPDGRLRDIRIFDFDETHQLASITQAESGLHQKPDHWRLIGVEKVYYNRLPMFRESLPESSWRTQLTPEVLSVLQIKPERMSILTLYAYVTHLEDNHQRADAYWIALWKKLVYPLATLVMLILALPFVYVHGRNAAVNVRVFLGVMLGVAFHTLNGLFSHLGVLNAWTPALAAATPGILFLCVAASMLWWVERR
jgi:lipopolysaccharide export system permease protein